MAASLSRSYAGPKSSRLTAVTGESAPHLTIFTIVLLLLLYGYEIFNFSLSPDEELYGYVYEHNWWLAAIAQGRWGMGLLDRVFPPLGNIPVLATGLFCASLGVSACVLARLLFRNHSAQLAFVGIFVSSPLWPHLAEFNITSWQIGIGCVLVTLSLLLMLLETRLGDIGAACILVFAIGIYESFCAWFVVLICIRHLSVLLGTAPINGTEARPRFPWLRSGLVCLAGLLGYLAVRHLLLAAFSLKLTYVQDFVRLGEFTTTPSAAVAQTLQRSWNMLSGSDPVFLDHGYILMLLPLLGLLIVVGGLLWRGPLKISERLLAGALLTAAVLAALSLVVVSAGTIPSRALTSLVPINAFLAAVTFSKGSRFEKLLYGALAAALFVSIWVNVSLFYTDHIARERDQVLAVRIMTRVDNILPNPPPGRIPFIVVGAVPAKPAGPFRRLEVFGDSFFDSSHEGGNPWRVAAYLRILGIDTLEPRLLEHIDPSYHPQIRTMPVWPAAGSVAMVNGVLVIKLGPLPPA
jgi:glucosyltransferase GtrII-like protein